MKFYVLFFLLKKKTLLKFNDKNKMLRLVKNWSRVFSVQKGKAKSNVLTLLFCWKMQVILQYFFWGHVEQVLPQKIVCSVML